MSPESLKAYHAANPSPEQEIADLRARLQTAEQQLGQVRKSLQNIIRDRGERDKVFITAKSALDLLDRPSDGCGKGRTDNSPAKTLLLRMVDLLDGEHEEEYFEALFQFLDLHSEIIGEASSSGEEGDS